MNSGPKGLIVGLALSAFVTSALHAKPQSDPGTIDVIGRKPAEVRQEAKDFVRSIGVAERPVARWIDPVCPKVIGVSSTIASKVENRIREIAKEARIRVARSPCDGNLVVSFVNDGAAIVREIAAKAPNQFAEVSEESKPLLFGSEAPIRWWHSSEERTVDGMRSIGNDTPPAVSGRQEQPGGTPLGGNVYQQYRPSFLSTQMVRAIRSASIIVDTSKTSGRPVESISAFAALVGLAEIELERDAPPNSILSLFKPDGPRELTALDGNFLSALYRLPLDRTATAHRGLLVRGLVNAGGK